MTRKRFSEPNRASSCFNPIAPTNGGRIIGTSNRPLSRALPRKSKRAMTCASGKASRVVNPVVSAASWKLFSNDCRCSGLDRSISKYLKLNRSSTMNAPLSTRPSG